MEGAGWYRWQGRWYWPFKKRWVKLLDDPHSNVAIKPPGSKIIWLESTPTHTPKKDAKFTDTYRFVGKSLLLCNRCGMASYSRITEPTCDRCGRFPHYGVILSRGKEAA